MITLISNFRNDYFFLSNYYPSPIVFQSICYPTMEHYFQAQKASSMTEKMQIAALPTPGEAKRAGRHIKTSLKRWDSIKDDVMLAGLRIKFSDPELRKLLLETGTEPLVEGNNWHDNYWGSCTCSRCHNVGKNKLGILLMQVRRELAHTVN